MSSLRNLKLTIAFDGTAYHGWQIQKQRPTVQGALCDAIFGITGETVALAGSGRTDAGTHARALVANFKTDTRIPTANLLRALNSTLPRDIRVLSVRRVPMDFHARRSARSKVYRYQIFRGPVMLPHLAREYFHYPYPLDVPAMEQAAAFCVGEHDFASFAAAPTKSERARRAGRDTVRRILHCSLRCRGRIMHLTIEGDGFLHHMVRNIAGTLLDVGRGLVSGREFRDLFQLRDRTRAGFTAPACGLVLVRVRY